MSTRGVTIWTLALLFAGCTGEAPQTGAQDVGMQPFSSEGQALPLQLTATQANGQRLFETVCWTCHGSAGRGDGPVVLAGSVPAPPNFMIGEYSDFSAENYRVRFREALSGAEDSHPHMRYVTSIMNPEKFEEALAYIPALTYPAEIPGSAIAGSTIYASRCDGCHGERGRGDGSAVEFLTQQPADFTKDTLIARHDWEALFRRIREGGSVVHGSAMPPWGMLFSDEQLWDLVAFISALQPGVFEPISE